MNIERYLKAAFLLQQRSINHIGVMEPGSKYLYQLHSPQVEALRQPSKVYSESFHTIKTGFPDTDIREASSLNELKSFSIMEIKDTFRFWEILGFMSTQEPGVYHSMKAENSTAGFHSYRWDGYTLQRSLSNPIENAYLKYTFKWDHPIVEINDVTSAALAEMI